MIPQEYILPFLSGEHALFTLVGQHSRFTFKLSGEGDERKVFLLTGPDNDRSYSFMGTLNTKTDILWTSNPKAPSVQALTWVWNRCKRGLSIEPAQVMHHGRCARCGRTLTTPESILTGIGPVCIDKA